VVYFIPWELSDFIFERQLHVAIHYIDGKRFKLIIQAGSGWVMTNKEQLNKINVFPVPDGDTGTNMSMTLSSAVREMDALKDLSLETTAKAAAWGGLMGARGNSGIILAQILGGVAESVEGRSKMLSSDVAHAFSLASKKAYKAVLNAAEGTILTVLRETAEAAESAALQEKDLFRLLSFMVSSAKASVERTPELLPKLKDAGVVDAGGLGFMFFLEGMVRLIQGVVNSSETSGVEGVFNDAKADYADHEWNFRFCTEFMLKGSKISEDGIKEALSLMGDSIVVVGDSRLARVHIHTGEPQDVLNYATTLGQVSSIKVDDMLIQHTSRFEDSAKKKATSVIAIALGDGFKELFYNGGAELVADGGPTQNPSTADIIAAIETVTSGNVILLPNHKNIYPAAVQAAEKTSKNTIVMKTSSVAEGLAALFAYMEDATTEDNTIRMEDAFARIKVGEVTEASRDVVLDNVDIKTGNSLGVYKGKVYCANTDSHKTVSALIAAMIEPSDEIITIYYGESVLRGEADIIHSVIRDTYPDKDTELYFGGQPYSHYILTIE
jgi:uncharacterized protein